MGLWCYRCIWLCSFEIKLIINDALFCCYIPAFKLNPCIIYLRGLAETKSTEEVLMSEWFLARK